MNYYNYFTEIEEHFVRRRGKHLMVSPLDWSLIATWRDSGVPMHVALRGIDIAMDKFLSGRRRESERPGTLFYCHDAVMAEYATYLEAHLGESPPVQDGGAAAAEPVQNQETDAREGPDKKRILEFIDARISEIKDVRVKHSPVQGTPEALDRILSRLEELARDIESGSEIELEALERDLGIMDELLVTELQARIPPEEMAEWEREAKKDLKIYKKRLPKETYEKIRENFMRAKIHRRFNVGEVSLFRL
jgi:hypothetical protein